jgi:hypothetical protein
MRLTNLRNRGDSDNLKLIMDNFALSCLSPSTSLRINSKSRHPVETTYPIILSSSGGDGTKCRRWGFSITNYELRINYIFTVSWYI